MTWHLKNNGAHFSGDKPFVQLEGTEGSAKNLQVRENAGVIEIYDTVAEAVVMTLENHSTRHKDGEDDPLDASSISAAMLKTQAKKNAISICIDDISTAETLYVMLPKCTVVKGWTVLSGVIADVDATVTLKKNGTGLTDGVITIGYSGSAAGDIDSCTPSALNAFDGATEYLEVAVGGESTNAVKVLLMVEFTMTD